MADEKRLTNEVTLVGKIVHISDIVERGEKGTEIITVRIEQPGKYKNVVEVEFLNDRIDEVLEIEESQDTLEALGNVRVRASVNGRVWKKDESSPEKVFMSLMGWSIKFDSTPVATKDRRAKRKGAAHSEAEPAGEMPGGDTMPGDAPEGGGGKRTRSRKDTRAEDEKPGEDAPF